MRNYDFSNFLPKVSLIFFTIILGFHVNQCTGFPRKIESWLIDVQPVGGVCVAPSTPCDFNFKFYSFDGSCNNPDWPNAGHAETPLARILPALYSDGYFQDRLAGDGQPLPLARLIQTTLFPNDFKPTNSLNMIFPALGQFITHDTTRSRADFEDPQLQCCINNAPAFPMPDKCRPLIVPLDDPFYSQFGVTCVTGRRLIGTRALDCGAKPVLVINDQSAWIDLSIVYAPNASMAQDLRASEGGLLKVKNDADTNYQNLPTITTGHKNCPLGGITFLGPDCLFGGDLRINQNVDLLIPDMLFLNFHNFVAIALREINPQWGNDDLYFNARRITTAAFQNIISNEYLILLIGPVVSTFYGLLPSTGSYCSCYNPKLNPQTFHSFTSSAIRTSHSTMKGVFAYAGPQGEPEEYKLRERLFSNQYIFQKNAFMNIVKAMTTQACDTQDQFFSEEIAEHMFEIGNSGYGNSLISVDINRGRENGLLGYNAFRVRCGYNKLQNWEEFYYIVARPESVEKLRMLYRGMIDDVDLYVALVLEKPVYGILGEVGACIVGAQYHHYKCADRLWYESESAGFSIEQLNSIRKITLSSIICSAMPEIREVLRSSLLIESPEFAKTCIYIWPDLRNEG